jgi:hypothetical protein
MVGADVVETVALQLTAARCPEDVFGPLPEVLRDEPSVHKRKRSLLPVYGKLSRACHPDFVEPAGQRRACQVFSQLDTWKKRAEQKIEAGLRDLFEAYDQHNMVAIRIVRMMGRALTSLISTCCHATNPSHIFLTGGVAHQGEKLAALVRDDLPDFLLNANALLPEIKVVPDPEYSALLGLSDLALRQITEESADH